MFKKLIPMLVALISISIGSQAFGQGGFGEADANQDGKVDAQELEQYVSGKLSDFDQFDELFAGLDKDKDDAISEAEFENRMQVIQDVMSGVTEAEPGEDDGFVSLFNGTDFEGWEQAGGTAVYRVENGVVIGESVAKTPNSFMCTKKLYGDFVLEYEYKCDNLLNSGVQFRSNVYSIETTVDGKTESKKIAAGRVHGYQVEIDPNKPDRMWSGGIYDEGRRGWLYPGSAGGDGNEFTKTGQSTYKPNEWNSVRVECNGNHIRTWLNGEARADFKDDMTPKGIIALQVHGVGKNEEAIGKTVMWRNLRIKELASANSDANTAK